MTRRPTNVVGLERPSDWRWHAFMEVDYELSQGLVAARYPQAGTYKLTGLLQNLGKFVVHLHKCMSPLIWRSFRSHHIGGTSGH